MMSITLCLSLITIVLATTTQSVTTANNAATTAAVSGTTNAQVAATTKKAAGTVAATTKKDTGSTVPQTTQTPAPTPPETVDEDFDELYVSDSDNGIVYVSVAPRGSTKFGTPQKLVTGLANPQGLALCGKPSAAGVAGGGKGGLLPYLFIADKGGDGKPGWVYRITLKRNLGTITMGKKEKIYGETTAGKREPTDVACDAKYLYIADNEKGKIKRVAATDFNKATCTEKTCDGDDWVGDECEGAVKSVKSLALTRSYLYWTTAKKDSPSNGVWRQKLTVKEAACKKDGCKGALKDEEIPEKCKSPQSTQPEFHKPTEDELYGVAALGSTGSTIYYTKGEDKVKSMSATAKFPKGPSTNDFLKGFKKITYIIGKGTSSTILIGTDKDTNTVYQITRTKKTKLLTVNAANGVAFSAGAGRSPNDAARALAVSTCALLVAALALLC